MNFLERANGILQLHPSLKVFPVSPGSKIPAIKRFAVEATRDPKKISDWARHFPNANVGIPTDGLLTVDIDNKNGKKGSEALLRLEMELGGELFPPTLEVETPTGGGHLFYQVTEPVKCGVDVLGDALDIRGAGGYVVGPGSETRDGVYRVKENRQIVAAPDVLLALVRKAKPRSEKKSAKIQGVDPVAAENRAVHYLLSEAKIAIEGAGGNATTFQVACRVKDKGVERERAKTLMVVHWNNRCDPPWTVDELNRVIDNAYAYGSEAEGSDAPEAQFTAVEPVKPDPQPERKADAPALSETEREKLSPILEMNRDYAYIAGSKGYVIHETKDEHDNPKLDFIGPETFHQNLLADKLQFSGKSVQLSRVWMESPLRRTYDGLCFAPARKVSKRYFNLWRGFAVEPAELSKPSPKAAVLAVELFFEHLRENVCQGDEKLAEWLTAYFAHAVQRPWELPGIALVEKGKKGVGKNVLAECVGHLFGDHFAVIAERNQLLGRFNSVLENKIMVVLDEAFWSGDKPTEGLLKHMITGTDRYIERKGKESHRVTNCLRVAIIGNEDWLVPATADERRYAVFNVGEKRLGDKAFFRHGIIDGMRGGGYALLLRRLLDFPLKGIDIFTAPSTTGLKDQKSLSLNYFQAWWRDCLFEERILGSDKIGWPEFILRDDFRKAFKASDAAKNWGSEKIGRELARVLPSHGSGRKRVEGQRPAVYTLPALSQSRREWEAYIGHEEDWHDADN